MRREKKLEGVGYSYIRFSAKEQERGDSLRRQTQLRDDWLKRHPGVTLDESLTLRDLGVSAFRGKHRASDTHALGQFLKGVESGRIPKGSLLLLENLDRLSREDELTATHLFTGILLAGITIVQLEPEAVFDRDSGQLDIMRAVLELGRAHAESSRKSVRVTAAWDEKKKQAAANGRPLTGRCPAWLRVVNGAYQFKPGARDIIRRMVRMCTEGHGCRAIAAAFNREGVKPWSPDWVKGGWEEAYVRKVIGSRAIVGEFQPMTNGRDADGKRVSDGALLVNYFPAAVDDDEWHAAQAARKLRDKRGGRPAKDPTHINPFSHLLFDARTRKAIQINGRVDRGSYYRVLVPAGSRRHGDTCVSFPLVPFEENVLDLLQELDPRELLPDDAAGGNAVLELSGKLSRIEGRLTAIQASLTDGDADVKGLMDTIRNLETQRKDTLDKLAAARRKASSPLSEAWGDARGVIATLNSAPDQREARVRLRSAIARIVESVWCLFLPRHGDTQIAVVQLWLVPGVEQRSYIIHHTTARAGKKGQKAKPARTEARSFKTAGLPGDLDLRDPKQAARLEVAIARAAKALGGK